MDQSRSSGRQEKESGEGFSSISGFLMVTIGFAVGVGSIWRFPYMLGENGGALFLIAYVVIIGVIGIPLLAAEISIGFKTQKSAVLAYSELAPGKLWYVGGYVHLVAGLLIISYTLPIYAWILKYLCVMLAGGFAGMDAGQVGDYFGAFTQKHVQVLLFALANIAVNALIISGGVKKGIERLTKILLPVLGVIMLILIVAGLRLPGAGAGVLFLLQPDPSKFNTGALNAALGQAFFAVGIAMLASMVFGSYIKNPKENIGKSASIICTALVCAGIMAGFMIFPVLFAAGLEPAAGPGLTFIALPNAFNAIPFGGVLGVLFFLGFYIAAVTSSAGVAESVVGLFIDQFRMSRKKAIAVTVLIMAVVGALCIFSDAVFNTLDLVENNYLLTLGALCIAIFVGWIWGADKFIEATNVKSRFLRGWLKVCVKYVSPIVIIFIFVSGLIG
ncbi:MAG: sodium-dependent transporter [Clostridiales Family XIII bacterium]|jgi:NSS family neurotransmitter:Na+ symporter|nr:sodium-dependent transporter [Clostridiales Family XIII bacterium]